MPATDDEAVSALCRRIDAADAFVVVTPEYNHSYPASLKHAIDMAYGEWNAKPVAFVSYGGISGGLRAVEALRHQPRQFAGAAWRREGPHLLELEVVRELVDPPGARGMGGVGQSHS
jgi:NAD(P)H-dependent FMN reductase